MATRKKGAARAQFELMSPDIRPNGPIAMEQVYNGFGCSGENVSPALAWSGAPEATKSFALLVHDPDAPTGGAGWWHWLVVNIPASATLRRRKPHESTFPCGLRGARGFRRVSGARATARQDRADHAVLRPVRRRGDADGQRHQALHEGARRRGRRQET